MTLNNDKTEALVVGSRKRVGVSQNNHSRVGSHNISFKSHVKGLRVYIDATLSVSKHIDHISRSAYLKIRWISSVRRLLTRKAAVQLMCSFVLSRLDSCNSLLSDITSDQMYPRRKNSKLSSRSHFLLKQTWACYTTSQRASLAPGQRKDTCQG